MKHVLFAVCAVSAVVVIFGATPDRVDNSVSGKVTAQATSEQLCMAHNIYYEAGVESTSGKYAVAQVTMNRVKTGRWGRSVCSVVYSPKQFSWTTKNTVEPPRGAAWTESQQIARAVLRGAVVPKLNTALYYHADYCNPAWRKNSAKIAKIGQHIFYSSAKITIT